MGVDAEKGKYASPEGSKTWEYLATFACSILMFCIGSAIGWNSPTGVKLKASDSPIEVSSEEISTLMSLIAIGQMIASPLNSVIVDRIGRKNTMIITGVPLIISWSLIALSQNLWVLYVARFTAGLSQGIGFCVCSMYVGEIASTSSRGIANVLMMMMLNLGTLMAFAVGPPLSISATAWLNLVICVLFVVIFWFMPESPYFFMITGRTDEAEGVLEKIRGKPDVSEEMEMIGRSLRSLRKLEESQKKTSLKSLLMNKAMIKGIVIVGLFSMTHHFGGYMAVMNYGQTIFEDLKISAMTGHLANVTSGVVQLISVGLTSLMVDRWGRKPLIAVSGIASGFFNLIIGVYFYLQEYTDINVSSYSVVPMIAVFLVVFAFNWGLLIVQGILLSEVFAPEVKAWGVCITMMNSGLMYTIGTKLYLTVAETWHYGHSPPFLLFVVVVWAITGVLLYIVPETKGKTLLEIQKALIE